VSDASASSTTLTISGDGSLKAIYKSTPVPPVIFEDGFESGDFSRWTGTGTTSGETAGVVSAPVLPHSGVYHARFTTDGGVSRAFCYKDIAGMSELYARVYVYIDAGLPLGTWNALWLIQFADSGGSILASYGVKANTAGTRWAVMRSNTNAYAASGPIEDRWYLVEAYFKKASTGKTIVLYVDGVEVASLSLNTASANDVARVRFGIGYSDSGVATTVYIDDATIDG